jgi:dienelactone hydrolase
LGLDLSCYTLENATVQNHSVSFLAEVEAMHTAAHVLRFSVGLGRSLVMLCVLGGSQFLVASDAHSNANPSMLNPPQSPIQLADLASLREVTGIALAPDGDSLAYTVAYTDTVEDKLKTVVWLARRDGSGQMPATSLMTSADHPRFSPDGNHLAVLSERDPQTPGAQIYLLDRRGGEAQATAVFKGGVIDFVWSPDSKKMAVIALDPPEQPSAAKDPPLVIDRYYFKEDVSGYLRHQRAHLYLLNLATGVTQQLTRGDFDERSPAWSPDGETIAYYSKRIGDPDRNETFGLYIQRLTSTTPQQLTTFTGESGDSDFMSAPVFSPDSKTLAFVTGGDPALIWYAVHHLTSIPVSGGTATILTRELDRNVMNPRWSADGKSIYFLVEDDRNQQIASVSHTGGAITMLTSGRRTFSTFELGPKDRVTALESNPSRPFEAVAVDGHNTKQISHQNDAWLSHRTLAPVEEINAKSADGTRVSGYLITPPSAVAGKRYPAILRIHGGPTSQYSNAFEFDWQLYAAHGYVVVAGNPRGSSGRGEAYAAAITADWGHRDGEDVISLVDLAVAKGIADPTRLGIGGWSYGAILTENVIVRDTRFKAAIAGAGGGNWLAGYGTDMYVRGYETEIGVPWKNLDTYLKISTPFLHADRITTPTLFMVGDKDFNVPLLNSEQMYEALRSVGTDTQLVIYPNEFHGFRRPSHLTDRLARYLEWYDKHLGVIEAANATR